MTALLRRPAADNLLEAFPDLEGFGLIVRSSDRSGPRWAGEDQWLWTQPVTDDDRRNRLMAVVHASGDSIPERYALVLAALVTLAVDGRVAIGRRRLSSVIDKRHVSEATAGRALTWLAEYGFIKAVGITDDSVTEYTVLFDGSADSWPV